MRLDEVVNIWRKSRGRNNWCERWKEISRCIWGKFSGDLNGRCLQIIVSVRVSSWIKGSIYGVNAEGETIGASDGRRYELG